MQRRPNRPRRAVSPQHLNILKTMGWRYSTTREAWVHRALGGRVGPVFREEDLDGAEAAIDTTLFEAVRKARQPTVLPESERFPLPQRAPLERPRTPVEVRLQDEEAPRVVLVDGRPPRRGIDPRALRGRGGVVVPIKKARATA